MASHENTNCHCSCGAAAYSVTGKPALRLFCHCTICQRFNQAAFADITIFRARDVHLPSDFPVEFGVHRPPPNVQRGKCSTCDKPAIEEMRLPLFPNLYFVPSANIQDAAFLPEPAAHLFYEHRIADANDTLPKYQGYWRSQLGSMRHLISAMLRG